MVYMNYNFVDTSHIEINENLKLNIYEVGDHKHKIIVIDDLLKNPEEVTSIVETHPFDSCIELIKWGHVTHLRFPKIKKIFDYLAKEHYKVNHLSDDMFDDKIKLQWNLVSGGVECPNRVIVPHLDQAFLAFSIFLTGDEHNQGGTGFYKHKKSGLDYDVSYFDEEFKKTESYWQIHETYRKVNKNDYMTNFDSRNIDEEEWELQFVVDAKFNRFVMHPSYMFHTFYIEKEWYQEEKRLSLAGFLL